MTNPYQILEVPESSSEDDVKRAYKKLAKKYHPDNKETGSDAKFKEITAAYEEITNPKPKEQNWEGSEGWPQGFPFPGNFGVDFGGFGFGQGKQIQFPHLEVEVPLTFEESVLGCKKTISVNKYIKCDSCHGSGDKPTSEKCKTCDGRGQKTIRTSHNMVMMAQCDKCFGSGKVADPCSDCNGKGAKLTPKNFEVQMPGALDGTSAIGLRGGGHWFYNKMNHGYSDIILHPKITKDAEMSINGIDVVSIINVSLIEALTGVIIKVRTVLGEQDLEIPKLSKNKDVLTKNGFGAVRGNIKGNHKFILNVNYPVNVDDLIKVLKENV